MKQLVVGMAVAALVFSGCAQPPTKGQQGAAIGTGVGAAVGAGLGQAIGGDTEATLLGAGIGAVVGGLTGGAVGRYMDQQEAAMRAQLAGVEGANIQRSANLLAVTFKSDLLFDVDSATLKPGSFDEMMRVAQVLNQYPQTSIMVAGHTDSSGSESYNQTLSERRAAVVKNTLVGQGVNAMRINAVGYGESSPVADNRTEYGRQLNRRVAITIMPQQ